MRKNMLVGDLQSVSQATLLKTLTIDVSEPISKQRKRNLSVITFDD